MPTLAQLSKELTKLKLKEVPTHVQKFAGQHWTPAQLQGRFMNWLHNYKIQVGGRAGVPGRGRRREWGDGRSLPPGLPLFARCCPLRLRHNARRACNGCTACVPRIRHCCHSISRCRHPATCPNLSTPHPHWLLLPQNIDTGSSKPLVDLVSYGFVFSYALSWPREYAHYKHEQEAKLKGGHH